MNLARRIAVVGASGVIGRRLLPVFAASGHHVRGASRSGASDRLVANLGAHPVRADILEPGTLHGLVGGCDIVVNLATAIPSQGPDADWAVNDSIRRDGTRHLVAACLAAAVPRLVQQSVAMLHSADDRAPQTESDPLVGSPALVSALEMEAVVRAAPFDWRIVRGGLLYGPGTRRLETWLSAIRTPGFLIPGNGAAWLSLVDVDDLAAAFAHLALHEAPREIYIACDDTPLQYDTLFTELARRADLQPPRAGGPLQLRSFRVTNAKLRRAGWRPAWPSLWDALNSTHAFDSQTSPSI